MFGTQANSMRPSPSGFRFSPQRRGALNKKPISIESLHSHSLRPTSSQQGGPGPNSAVRVPACGVQRMSCNTTAPFAAGSKDSRFGYVERFQRATLTPGPGAYSPC